MKRELIKKVKQLFYNFCIEEEHAKIQSLCLNYYSRYNSINYPRESEVLLATRDHVCNVCCDVSIKKDTCYFRRSFGQVWTIKACSIYCFINGLP